jgi:hypothetical protein
MTKTETRKLFEGMEALKLALDPEMAQAKAEWEEAEAKRQYVGGSHSPAIAGRTSGWRQGPPQCPACRRILAQKDGWCPDCRTFAGRHDHGR